MQQPAPASTAAPTLAQQAHVIEQSHERCAAIGLSRIARPDYAPLGRPDLALLRERNRRLHQHAAPVMEMLYEQIAGGECMVVLCDSSGTIIHSTGDADFLARASQVALQPGVNWSEPSKGTNAIGTALVEEAPVLVHAGEHYLHANHFLTCSAAPILDPRGNVLGVLDVTGDHRSYHRHTMALVRMSARMIENHWLAADPSHAMRVHFHHRPEFIGTLMEGIVAVAADGRIVGANRSALEMLAASGVALRMQGLAELFGVSMAQLADRFASSMVLPLAVQSSNGHTLHLVARCALPAQALAARPAMAAPVPVATPPSPLADYGGGDAAVAALHGRLARVAAGEVPVLLVGEPGTGKATWARAVHAASPRASAPCVALSCEGLEPAALEAAWRSAQHGSLLLLGAGALGAAAAAALLRLLREDTAPRLLATARQTLSERAAQGLLRDELPAHLEGLVVRVPKLVERSDLRWLVAQMLGTLAPGTEPAEPVLARLASQPWPGNLRQLHQVLRAAVALAGPGRALTLDHLGLDTAITPATAAASLQAVELQAMRDAVAAAGGNFSEAARRLGVSRNTLYRRLRWKGR